MVTQRTENKGIDFFFVFTQCEIKILIFFSNIGDGKGEFDEKRIFRN